MEKEIFLLETRIRDSLSEKEKKKDFRANSVEFSLKEKIFSFFLTFTNRESAFGAGAADSEVLTGGKKSWEEKYNG